MKKLQRENFLEMVDSGTELLFAYDSKQDILYFSRKANEVLGGEMIVRHYWKASSNWNWISQRHQEELINIIRHELRDNGEILYRVPVKGEKTEGSILLALEITILWNEGISTDILGVRGKMQQV